MSDLITLQAPSLLPAAPYTDGPVMLRKATLRDIPAMQALINNFAAQGIMLPRTEFEMAENIRDFTIVLGGGEAVACAALHIYSPTAAEVRSLAVHPAWQKHGLGKMLVEAVEAEAREFGLASLFAFTYVEKFFSKLDFLVVERGELPLKAWKDCLQCPKFQACDEIAMLKKLI